MKITLGFAAGCAGSESTGCHTATAGEGSGDAARTCSEAAADGGRDATAANADRHAATGRYTGAQSADERSAAELVDHDDAEQRSAGRALGRWLHGR